MDLNSLTGTSVALILLYLQLALGVSAATELISTLMDYRAKDLDKWLREHLTDGFADRLLSHPLIHARKGKLVAGQVTWHAPARVSPGVLAAALKAVLASSIPAGGVYAAQAGSPPPPKLPAVAALETEAELETWFNEGMERLGADYARWARKLNLAIALLVAFLLNADTFRIVKELPGDEAARSAATAAAAQIAANGLPKADAGTDPEVAERLESAADELTKQLDTARAGALLGWPDCDGTISHGCLAGADLRGDFLPWLMRLAGIFTTALATSLGAPFWFDLLKKFVGAPAAETPKK